MKQITVNSKLEFECKMCLTVVDGDDQDVWIDGVSFDQEESAGMFDRLFKNAAFDRTGYIVKRTCSQCKLDFMKLVRVGEDQNVVIVCDCGNQENIGHTMVQQ
jgi:hypothetical protein